MERDNKKVYKVRIVEENTETGDCKVIVNDEKFVGVALSADCGDGRLCEIIINDCIHDIANRIAQSQNLKRAAVVAAAYLHMEKRLDADDLMKMIMED